MNGPQTGENARMAPDTNLDTNLDTDLDLTRWPRRATFEFYRSFEQPFFSVCTRIDVSALRPALAQVQQGSHTATITLACHFLALQLANRMEPWRYRLLDGRVRVLAAVHASTTVLRADDSFGFAYLRHASDYACFAAPAAQALAAARTAEPAFVPRVGDAALLHFTTLPWLHFTSFAHARHGAGSDSVPKIAFGRIDNDATGGPQRWLPLQLDVHHALMDGVHVGRFVQAFEAAMHDPLPWLQGGAVP
jgi:chloramphenicol O-acetyltransferase type A